MKKMIVAVSVLAAVASVLADITYVVATGNKAGIYEREIRKVYDTPLFTVGTVDRLLVLETGKNCYKIKRSSGETGWIEKRLVKKIPWRGFVFEGMEVMGYPENPTPVVIIGKDDSPEEMIVLNRSFRDALKENIDRETVYRQVN